MFTIMVVLSIAGFALIVAGFMIQLRNRSPYSGARMDQAAMKRVGVGTWLATLGVICIVVSQLVRSWR